jgi:hypothetical protein
LYLDLFIICNNFAKSVQKSKWTAGIFSNLERSLKNFYKFFKNSRQI